MQRPFIFVATADLELEQLATDAILESRHGVRRARSPGQAIAILGNGVHGIALAIIDTTSDPFGKEFLQALVSYQVDLPILAIRETGISADFEYLNGIPIMWLSKPVTFETLRDEVRYLCHATCAQP